MRSIEEPNSSDGKRIQARQDLEDYEPVGPFSILRLTDSGPQKIMLIKSSPETSHADPFKAVDQETGKEVGLSHAERVNAYSQFNIKIPPELLVKQRTKHGRR